MGVDDWERMAPWLRRAVASAASQPPDQVLDALVESLSGELLSQHPATTFSVHRRGETLFVEWSGDPSPSQLADEINVDPTYPHASGVEVGTLYGEDLPQELATVTVLLKHRA